MLGGELLSEYLTPTMGAYQITEINDISEIFFWKVNEFV